MRYSFLLMALVSCLPPGDYHCQHGEGVSFYPGVKKVDLCPEINHIHEAGAKICASADGDTSRIRVEVTDSDLECGGRMVHGCALYPGLVYVRDASLLPDEIGHLIWWSCFGRGGEHVDQSGAVVYDPDFQAFLGSL